ncbi:alginate biosynthesis protein AlgA [bacterium MnTg02]|nr:alginate biosynthesis protein AlgA [bacterium MnTg02]
MSRPKIYPFILCGGSGERLWPLSRKAYPKQFLKLVSKQSLLQETCLRVRGTDLAPPSLLAAQDHRFLVAEQLREIDVAPRSIILEPVARNTAPAALISALTMAREDPNRLILLLPSDHCIADAAVFHDAVQAGIAAADNGHLITFGIKPDRPETGYGYIETRTNSSIVRDVERFIEKPSRQNAEDYILSDRFSWNAGIFLFSAKSLIRAFETHAPEILAACREALDNALSDLDFLRLDETAYSRAENISLDYAILEKASGLKSVMLQTQWSDLGAWPAIWQMMSKDENGNVARGDVALRDTKNSYVHSEDGANLTLIGLRDVLAIATKDAILVAAMDHAQQVKDVVNHMKAAGRDLAIQPSRVCKPWGWYETLMMGERFQVKCIMVKPGGKLSLQSHRHRAEHWVVVKGALEVTVGDTVKLLSENEYISIPLGEIHRLANPKETPGYLIEIQSGSYLGEDDIVRYDDIYGRAGP